MSIVTTLYLADIPMVHTITELDNDETAAELVQELVQRLGITVDALNRPATEEERASIPSWLV